MYELVTLNASIGNAKVRTLTDHDGNNYYAAQDLAVALGYINVEKAISDHCKHQTPLNKLDINHAVPDSVLRYNTNMITDADMNRLIFASRLATAEVYKDWVFEDVLPSLRRKGEYTKADMQVAARAMAQVSAGDGSTDFATEIASLKAELALAQQEAQAQAQIAQEAQRKLGRTIFEITLRRNENKATLSDWKHRFEPLRCVYEGVPDKWGTKYNPKEAVAALAPYAEAAQDMIGLALQVKPALYHALSQSGMGREQAIEVVKAFNSYVKKEGEV